MRKCNVGGQAVIEGVMMRGEKCQATAVRTPSGYIKVDKQSITPIHKKYKFLDIPFIRGFFVLVDSLMMGMKSLDFSSQFFEEEEEEPSKIELFFKRIFKDKFDDVIMGMTFALSAIIAIGLFLFIPTFIVSIFRPIISNVIALNTIEAIIRISILLGYMYLIGQIDDIKRLFQYHGAEHKTIFCYENEEELTVENVKKYPRFHPRCGTNFIFLVMVVGILVFSLVEFGSVWQRLFWRILLIPVITGITYELIKWLGRSEGKLAYLIATPGLQIQRLTTREPDNEMIEVAIKALKEAEGIKDIEKNLGEVLDEGIKVLKDAGVDSYIIDAQLLMCNLLKVDRVFVLTKKDKKMSRILEEEYMKLINERAKKVPIKYITGEAEFYGINLKVKPGVLIPRSETELLVEKSLELVNNKENIRILDLCCGSGAIGIAMANNTDESVVVDLIDIDSVPEEVTNYNIKKLNLENRARFIKSDLLKYPIENKIAYDFILSNPPYIEDNVVEELMDDVKKYEPHLALKGGEDGLDFYRRIIEDSPKAMNNGAYLIFEIGHNQGKAVKSLMEDKGFLEVKVIKDYANLDRIVLGHL